MKDIFANLYNKVVSFFHQTENNNVNAKDVACNRLKLVLMQDRTNLSPAIMERMRKELIDLLSKYLELDRELLDLNFEQEDSQMALMLSIPVIRAKSEDEILAILEEEDSNKNSDEDAEDDESENSENSDEDSEVKTEDGSDNKENSEEDDEEKENTEETESESNEKLEETSDKAKDNTSKEKQNVK